MHAVVVNDGGAVVGLLTDMKFMAYLFNFFACLYTTFLFKGNHFILCATVSSLCGALGTIFVAVHSTLMDHNGVIPVNAHIALLIPIEITWGSSEFFAMITTYFKIKMFTGELYHDRNQKVLAVVIGIFAPMRLTILVFRAAQGVLWSEEIYYAHVVYLIGLSFLDVFLTYLLYSDLRTLHTELNFVHSRYCGLLSYTIAASLSRVVYMNVVMWGESHILTLQFLSQAVVALSFLDLENNIALSVQNLFIYLKFNFGLVFLIDLLLSHSKMSPRISRSQSSV